MDLRIMNRSEFESSKQLWQECFPEDSADFIESYYEKRTKPEYVLGAFFKKGEAAVAMLHIIPIKMTFGEKERSIGLIAGVCTKPEYRRRGLCSRLIKAAVPIMKERGFEAAVLNPFDPSFYARFGFKTFIFRQKVSISAERLKNVGHAYENISCAVPDPERLLSEYYSFMHGFSGYSLRDANDMERMIADFSAPDARLIVSEKGCCAGYAEGEEGDTFLAFELFWQEGEDPLSLLPEGFSKYVFPLPSGVCVPKGLGSVPEEFSMILPLSADFDLGSGPYYGFDRY